MKRHNYMTAQRKSLIDFLSAHSERHFTIDEIIAQLHEGQAQPGRSTVYRQMKKLVDSGAVRRFESPDSRSFVYQYANDSDCCEAHFHLKCSRCGRLIHMDCERLSHVRSHIEAEHDFIIGAGKGIIYGECTACAASHTGEEDCCR